MSISIRKNFLYTPLFIMLSACGSGGGSGGSNNAGGGTSITEAEFIQGLTTGIIRFDSNVDFSGFSSELEFGGETVTITTSGTVTGSQVMSIQLNSATNATTEDCDLELPVTEDLTDTLNDDDNLELVDCTDSFFKISDTQYRIDSDCTGVIPSFSVDVIYISDNPQFNLGELSINSESEAIPNIAANTGVCGNIAATNTTTITTPDNFSSDEKINNTIVQIVAPYVGGNKIELEFIFSGTGLTANTFNVVSVPSADATDQVSLTLRSLAFGGAPGFPISFVALNGTVTLTSVGDKSYTGNYDVDLGNGTTVIGAFSFDLK